MQAGGRFVFGLPMSTIKSNESNRRGEFGKEDSIV
jgi:hypothetical protein